DPERDADLLAALSPLRRAEDIRAPVLVIHGEGDTNVPVSESHQMVAALRALGRDVEYLQLDGEGHEFRRMASRHRLLLAITGFLERTIGARSETPAALSPPG
ncbi:MAG TPA: prolyl oligopeptidase family serine peptidase, partial [Actinomycetota bacterium]|nr:prolyl oligopeptidase family serine peptidase [Actinomycetota bacterium]